MRLMRHKTAPQIPSAAQPPAKTVRRLPRPSAVKKLCFDEATGTLRPNLVLVDDSGATFFEINELGLKGAARDPARKLAVVWGDSVVFGVRWSWPCLIDGFAFDYQFLNGGIEADPYGNILRRAADFNRRHDVALNVLLLGWHPIIPPSHLKPRRQGLAGSMRALGVRLRGDGMTATGVEAAQRQQLHDIRAALPRFLQTVPNTVLATTPSALNSRVADRDLSACFNNGGPETLFSFAGDLVYSVEVQRYLFDWIRGRNSLLRDVARERGTRLVDLEAVFETEGLDDFRADFHDVLHLRPTAYPKAAAAVYEAIKDLL